MKKKIFLLIAFLTILASSLLIINANNINANKERNVYEVLEDYYNAGVYEKDTIINLSEEGVVDLATYFHVENHLVRKTYYSKDALWMSQGAEANGVRYSYYGTSYDEQSKPNGVTYAVVDNPLENPENASVVLKGEGKNSMEEYYTTLFDISKYNAQWSYKDGVYTTTDEVILGYFLDFTAPCLYSSVINSNVFSYEKATIEINNIGALELKLWVSSTDYGFIDGGDAAVIDGACVLSVATIGHNHAYYQGKDSTHHYDECICGVKENLVEHNFDNGKVYNDITMEYTCKTCGYIKYDVTEDDLTAGIDNSKYGLAIRVPEDRDIKIAQFADIHFGVDGKDWHNFNLDRIKLFIVDAVKRDRPDLIVCSGDNIIGTGIHNSAANEHDLVEFIEFMEQFEIPWTFMYGNHDAESKKKIEYSEYLLQCVSNGTTKYLMYTEEYVEKADSNISIYDQGRYGNFSIQVLNPMGDKLLGSIILFDAGTYLYDQSIYQSITPGQVNWYEQKINTLQALYSKQEGNLYDVIPTIVFSHIQLPEHKIAYKEAYYNQTEGYEFVIRQDEVAGDFKNVSNQKPNTDSGLFDKMVELGSTKAYFVGHAHSYKFQVTSHGIVLGYAPNTGLSKLDGNGDLPRDLYTYNVSPDFSFTTTVTQEHPVEPNGLTYSYSSSVDEYDRRLFNYDVASDTYYGLVDFKEWGKIRLRYNGVCLTPENTIITGDFNNNGKNETNKLYQGADKTQFVFGTARYTQIAFTYNVKTNTLNIHVLRDVTYGGNHTGNATYDVLNNRYTFTVALPAWGRVDVKVDGVQITDDNITGAFYKIGREHASAQWDRRLYTDGNNYSMICCIGTQGDATVTNTFQFSYLPTTGKLYVAYSDIADKVNTDNSWGEKLCLWTKAGTLFAENNNWAIQQNGYRLFIVVDKNGKICYMVHNPVNGYGSPYEVSHYSHSDYWKNNGVNPCLKLYTSGDSRRYDVFIPEGGFGITAHGAGTTKILTMLGLPTSDVAANVNKTGILSDDVRLGYDSTTNTIFVYK